MNRISARGCSPPRSCSAPPVSPFVRPPGSGPWARRSGRSGPGSRRRSRRPGRSPPAPPWPAWRPPGRRSPATPRWRRAGALLGADQGLPRRHPPAAQVELHRRQPEPLPRAPLDQLAHRARGPERERRLQPVGRPLGDPIPDPPGLVPGQPPLAAPRRDPPAVEEAVLAPLAIALLSDVHRLAVHADRQRGFGLGHPLALDQEQGPTPQRLLRRPAEAAKIPCFHASSIAACAPSVRDIVGGLVTTSPAGGHGKA